MKNLSCYMPLNKTSYGYVSSYLFIELLKTHQVDYFPIGGMSPEDRFLDVLRPHLNQDALFQKDAPCLKIWHQHDLSSFIGSGPRIGFPIFELDKFTTREKNHLGNLDEIIVCSEWARSIIKDQVGKESSVVPLGVDRSIFKETPLQKGSTVFANFGKWEIRKGHDILQQAFNAAFDITDKVELWMMPKNVFLREDQEKSWHDYYLKSKLGSKVRIYDRVETQSEVYSIMQHIDCGVFPARAEGWNLEALEVLSCGKHLIITDSTAHTEYSNQSNAKIVHLSEDEQAYDGVFFYGQGSWKAHNQDSFDSLVNHMREIHRLKMEDGLLVNQVGIETAKQFSWENSGVCLNKALSRHV